MRRLIGSTVAALVALAALAPSAFAAFGVQSFDGEFFATKSGTAPAQAGSHPYLAGASLRFNVKTEETEFGPARTPEGAIKDVDIELPAGLIGDPSATPKCPPSVTAALQACPADTQIGVARLLIGGGESTYALYNTVPPPGVPALFTFLAAEAYPVSVTATVRPAASSGGEGYGLDLHIHNIVRTLPIEGASLDFYGNPPSGGKPFVTMPTSCSGNPPTLRAHVTSWQGGSDAATLVLGDDGGNPLRLEGCGRVPFAPQLSDGLDATSTDSPAGLSLDVKTPQSANPEGLATANLRSATVTLPAGVSVNPSAAAGLLGCTVAQFDQFGEGPSACPDAAKVGSAEIDTPLLEDPLTGGIYLARQTDNPFGSTLALYLIAEADGVQIKLPGEVSPDPTSGQLTATFDEAPQLPFEELKLHFFEGPGAALATPVTCGTGDIGASLAPWSGNPPAGLSSSITVSSGPGGSACPASASARPFGLGFEAGTVSPAAALHSPLELRVSRPDGAQELGRIDATLPKGLLATLKGVPECAAGNAAAGTCAAASQVGSLVAGAGAGPDPYLVGNGRAYLTGPYGGAPLGLDFVVPAVAGPLDLGTVNVRAALFVDPETAQVTVRSDPLPRILAGIPLRLRSLDIGVDRPGFVVNPTSCDPTTFAAQVTSTEGAVANLSDRFQAAGCRSLAFAPQVKPRLLGARKALRRGGHPKLRVALTQKPGGANLQNVSFTLPRSILLDQSHIKTVCTRVQFAAGKCPKASVYGRAKVYTPLLEKQLEGPVYLRSSNNPLPDLVFDLKGQIGIVLAGRIDSKGGGIRVSFGQIPDAAVSRFVLNMKGGARGLLQSSTDLCARKGRAVVKTRGQNGAVKDTRPVVGASCGRRK